MYKLLHVLFGWDYVAWRNSADQGIARVYEGKCGRVYYWRYRSTRLFDIIEKPEHVLWLTCDPSRYFPLQHTVREALIKRVKETPFQQKGQQ
jgi:hypothetical protein